MKRAILLLLLSATPLCAATLDVNRVADAIYRAEGGARAKEPYGILAVHVHNAAEARRVCIRTIRHAWRDYQLSPQKQTFIYFLADRYCPPSVDPIGNRNWKHNVTLLCR